MLGMIFAKGCMIVRLFTLINDAANLHMLRSIRTCTGDRGDMSYFLEIIFYIRLINPELQFYIMFYFHACFGKRIFYTYTV